jgi:ElaA protein
MPEPTEMPPDDLRLRQDSGTPKVVSRRFGELNVRELHDLLRLRCDVFVVEQACAYPELDGRDDEPGTRHHWIVERTAGTHGDIDRIVVCARTLAEADGATRIGRVATARSARGRGLAGTLIAHLVETVDGELVLDAQAHLVDWYGRFGFAVDGEEFVEDGIPHVPMRRAARPSNR